MTETGRREEFATTEVIRPAAVLMESAARRILAALTEDDVRHGGTWLTSPGVWQKFDRPWPRNSREPGPALHLGTIRSIYDSPQRYSVTIFRASITPEGIDQGWSVDTLCDDALQHASLTLADCPRATLFPPPEPFREVRAAADLSAAPNLKASDLSAAANLSAAADLRTAARLRAAESPR